MDDKSGSESDSDASTSASDEEADEDESKPRKRPASVKTKAAALDILQGVTTASSGLYALLSAYSLLHTLHNGCRWTWQLYTYPVLNVSNC